MFEALAGAGAASSLASAELDRLTAGEEPLHAPSLLEFEVANALTKAPRRADADETIVERVLEELPRLPLVYHRLAGDARRAVEIATLLGRQSAYDASYLALAERLGMPLITLDGALQRNARSLGFDVRAIS